MVKEVKILRAYDPGKLEKYVNTALEDGWELSDTMTASLPGRICQMVVRDKPVSTVIDESDGLRKRCEEALVEQYRGSIKNDD